MKGNPMNGHSVFQRALAVACCLLLAFSFSQIVGSGPARALAVASQGENIISTPMPKPWEAQPSAPTPPPSRQPAPISLPTGTTSPVAGPTVGPSGDLPVQQVFVPAHPPSSLDIPFEEEAVIEDYDTPLGVGDAIGTKRSVLLIGVDSHGADNNGRSDAVILASVDVATGEAKLVSFLRDLYVNIPGKGKNRLNAAYFYGGAELLKKTLESNFKVSIDNTIALDFRALVRLIDQMGGLPVTVDSKEVAQLNKLLKEYNRDYGMAADDGLVASAGEQTLSGKQTLCFSRIRKADSDFLRAGRQRRVIEGLFSKVRGMSLPQLLALAGQSFESIQTDLTMKDAASLLPLLLGAKDMSVTGMQVPLENAFHDDVVAGMMVLVPNIKKNEDAIQKFLQ